MMTSPSGGIRRRLALALHRQSLFRRIAKRLCRGVTIRQSFYGGAICLDAVEHSWAWTGGHTYEQFDRPLQDALLALSRDHPWMVDIGSNLGAMTLSVLLRNPRACAVAVDPNPRTRQLLQKSLGINGLNGRCRVINAAVAPDRTAVRFDFSGSVVGHVTDSGVPVPTVTVAELLRGLPAGEAPLIKVDIEGFESRILPDLIGAARASRAVVVIELHPQGLNGLGDPAAGLELLRAGGAVLTGLDGRPLPALNPADFTQVVARWA